MIGDCYICTDNNKKLINLSCSHQLCCDCISSLRSLSCPYCRKTLSSDDIGNDAYVNIMQNAEVDKAEREDNNRLFASVLNEDITRGLTAIHNNENTLRFLWNNTLFYLVHYT